MILARHFVFTFLVKIVELQVSACGFQKKRARTRNHPVKNSHLLPTLIVETLNCNSIAISTNLVNGIHLKSNACSKIATKPSTKGYAIFITWRRRAMDTVFVIGKKLTTLADPKVSKIWQHYLQNNAPTFRKIPIIMIILIMSAKVA